MMVPSPNFGYDVVIVGAGVAGCEAALACAKADLVVLLVTTSLDTVYSLIGEGVVLDPPQGTLMAQVHGRLAGDSGFVPNWEFHRRAKYLLEEQPKVHLLQSSVTGLYFDGGRLAGVTTWEGVDRRSPRVALCVGSFLKARLRIGGLTETAGRLSEMAYDDLYEALLQQGLDFSPVTLEARPTGGALPYRVHCMRFGDGEWNAESFALTRVPGLYAAGVCAVGPLPFEDAARQGVQLANALVSARGEQR